MKKILLFLSLFIMHSGVRAVVCTGGTFTNATGTINDGGTFVTATAGTNSGTSTAVSPITTGTNDGMRTQYTIIASELANGGFVAGQINSIAFNLGAGSGTVPDLKIRISDTPFSDLVDDYDEMIWTDVFGPQAVTIPSSPGLFTFNFTTPYIWDGLSNILIDICHSAPTTIGVTPSVTTNTQSFPRAHQGFGNASCTLFTYVGPTTTRPVFTLTQKLVYNDNSNCSFLISPGAGFTSITLNFTDFVTELTNDVVTVYDGPTTASPVLGQFSGDLTANLPSVTSTGNQMLVNFISNASIVNTGWEANYTSNAFCTPSISISGNTNICSGELASFSAILQNEGNNPSIEWFVNNVSQIIGSTFSSSTLNNSDNVRASLTSNAVCASPVIVNSNTITMNVLPAPNVGIVSNPPGGQVCAGSSITLSGTGAQSYSWNGITDGVAFMPISNATYTVIGTDANNCTATSSINVFVNSQHAPTPGNITGPKIALCNATNISYSINPLPNTSLYQWNVNGGNIINGQGTNSILVDFGTFINGSVSVNAINGCGSGNQRTINIKGKPDNLGPISGDKKGLCNTTGTYSVTAISGTTGYQWTNPPHTTILNGQGTTSILLAIDNQFNSGKLNVKAFNACGNSNSSGIDLNGEPFRPVSISGPAGVCRNQSGVQYSTPLVANVISYYWKVPQGAIIQSGQNTNTITVRFGRNNGDIEVRTVNGCGMGEEKKLKVKFICREDGQEFKDEPEIYPNPVVDVLRINIPSDVITNCEMILTDISGRIIFTEERNLSPGENHFEVDCSRFSNGVYFLRINRSDEDIVTKIILDK